MRLVHFLGNEQIEVIEAPIPALQEEGCALVRIEASSLCGSDLNGYRQGIEGSNAGHEAAGVVEEVQGEAGVKPGDRVVLFASKSCGACRQCRKGNLILCTNKPSGGWPLGWHADYAVVQGRQCMPLPDDIPIEVGAILGDAVGVPFRAARRIALSGFDRMAIFGLGPMGLMAVAIAKLSGATVYGVDPSPERRALAQTLGVADVFDPTSDDLRARVNDCTRGDMLTAVFECSGTEAGLQQALSLLGVGGRMAVIGENPSATINPSDDLIHREISMHGVFYYSAADFLDMCNLVRTGLPVDKLVTHRFPIEKAAEAYQLFANHKTGKVLLTRD